MKSAQLTREAFEKWFAGLFGNKFNGSNAGRFGWYYFDDETDLAWQSWQAALQSLPAPDAAQESAEQAVKQEPCKVCFETQPHTGTCSGNGMCAAPHPAQSERTDYEAMERENFGDPDKRTGIYADAVAPRASAQDPESKRVAELEAARMAYASEFPLNADGEPDVGNIHANIRKLKKDAARYRWLKEQLTCFVQFETKNGKTRYRLIDDGEPAGKWHDTYAAAIDAAMQDLAEGAGQDGAPSKGER